MNEGEVFALLIVAVSSVTALKILTRAWVQKKEFEFGGKDSALAKQVEELRFEVEELRAEQRTSTAELHERIDFAERLLTSSQRGGPEEPPPA
jgi:hypothetical protein